MKIELLLNSREGLRRTGSVARRIAERERCEVIFTLRDRKYLFTPRMGKMGRQPKCRSSVGNFYRHRWRKSGKCRRCDVWQNQQAKRLIIPAKEMPK